VELRVSAERLGHNWTRTTNRIGSVRIPVQCPL
jgi:hypothetical protein